MVNLGEYNLLFEPTKNYIFPIIKNYILFFSWLRFELIIHFIQIKKTGKGQCRTVQQSVKSENLTAKRKFLISIPHQNEKAA